MGASALLSLGEAMNRSIRTLCFHFLQQQSSCPSRRHVSSCLDSLAYPQPWAMPSTEAGKPPVIIRWSKTMVHVWFWSTILIISQRLLPVLVMLWAALNLICLMAKIKKSGTPIPGMTWKSCKEVLHNLGSLSGKTNWE